MKVSKKVLLLEHKELYQLYNIIADDVEVIGFDPAVLKEKTYENTNDIEFEKVAIYLVFSNSVKRCKKYVWEAFLNENGIDNSLIDRLISVFIYVYTRKYDHPAVLCSRVYVHIDKNQLMAELEKIIQEEKEKILNPECLNKREKK